MCTSYTAAHHSELSGLWGCGGGGGEGDHHRPLTWTSSTQSLQGDMQTLILYHHVVQPSKTNTEKTARIFSLLTSTCTSSTTKQLLNAYFIGHSQYKLCRTCSPCFSRKRKMWALKQYLYGTQLQYYYYTHPDPGLIGSGWVEVADSAGGTEHRQRGHLPITTTTMLDFIALHGAAMSKWVLGVCQIRYVIQSCKSYCMA